MGKVTVQDIAAALGISTAAVSMALHDKPGVSKQVRQTVCEKAEEMGYVVKERAQRKKPQAALTPVLLLIRQYGHDCNQDQFFIDLLVELERVAGGLLVRSVDSPNGQNNEEIREKLAEISRQASYIILLATDLPKETLETVLSLLRCPVIVFDQNCWWLPAHTVSIDNTGSILDGVQYYRQQGCTRFGFLASEMSTRQIYNFQERLEGFKQAVKLLGISDAQILTLPAENAPSEQKKAFCRNLSAQVYFSAQDAVTFRAGQLIQEFVPEKLEGITLVGYDNVGLLESLPVSTASFGLNRDVMAKKVVELGVQLAAGQKMAPSRILIRSTLKINS